jgi:hypothetical protein
MHTPRDLCCGCPAWACAHVHPLIARPSDSDGSPFSAQEDAAAGMRLPESQYSHHWRIQLSLVYHTQRY